VQQALHREFSHQSLRPTQHVLFQMSSEWFRTKGVVAAAVGAGILIGAAGILLFQQMMAEKKRLDRVASSVSLLRRELDTLKRFVYKIKIWLVVQFTFFLFTRALFGLSVLTILFVLCVSESKPLGSSSRSRPRSEARSLSDVDMFSTVSRLDEEDEEAEFFDLSDDEMIIQVNR